MPVTSYYSVGGEILGERTDGGGRTNYGVDALGSVTSTLVGDAVVNRYSYKPYGAELSRSGAGADPSFRWVGSLGYRSTGRSRSEQYVRARHYDAKGGRWSTVDPLWPEEPQYGYAGGSPGVGVDPSGKAVIPILCIGACVAAGGCALGVYIACKDWRGAWGSFGECAYDYLKSLPAHSLVGCGVGMVGCIACLAKYAKAACRNAADGRCTDAEWNSWHPLIHNPMSCDGPRNCDSYRPKKTPEKCAAMDLRIANGTNCVASRLGRQLMCYKTDNKLGEHSQKLTEAFLTLEKCVIRRAMLGCP